MPCYTYHLDYYGDYLKLICREESTESPTPGMRFDTTETTSTFHLDFNYDYPNPPPGLQLTTTKENTQQKLDLDAVALIRKINQCR